MKAAIGPVVSRTIYAGGFVCGNCFQGFPPDTTENEVKRMLDHHCVPSRLSGLHAESYPESIASQQARAGYVD